jgi:hypothetical protein
MPSYGFVHCFPLGATAVLTLALCINQLRGPPPPEASSSIQAYDQRKHYFIQTLSDALDHCSGP